jgi:hypothetical protein
MQDSNIRKLADIKPEVLLVWFEQFDQLGSADMILTDGNSLVCFHGTHSQTNMYYTRRKPPSKLNAFVISLKLIALVFIFLIAFRYRKKDVTPVWAVPTIFLLTTINIVLAIFGGAVAE